ncbi:hypothetical protein KSB_27800 [Ktedonobacter robiniae]|uniref:DUF1496 domain-containing protein n=1 Tax=Ktedonobacter robiniae TaxID=2778365 RepID=A0ABQ3UNL0_9CHLR|nr:hypothetical protein KSB_27800 [Ktedonobacter robiniae]
MHTYPWGCVSDCNKKRADWRGTGSITGEYEACGYVYTGSIILCRTLARDKQNWIAQEKQEETLCE